MWCFKGQNDLCVYILPNCKKSFGKLASDVKLEGDATISRLHAIVSVESTKESDIQYKCIINDLSKYGTFVTRDGKKIKLPKSETFLLKTGDTVQFGLKETIFVVKHHSFVTARSSLNEKELNRLKNIMDHVGGQLLDTWENSCTHLTVSKSVLFTTKLVCALASSKPIVTIAYWEAVNLAIEESKELPEIEAFLPMIKEDWLKVSPRLFLPNEKRRTLFKGLSFVYFCAKQYYTYASLITSAGGKSCVYPTKRPLTPRDLTAKNAIVIQQPVSDSTMLTQDISADYQIVYHKLQAVKRRLISDTEIPLAILHCTTERYCNPKFDFATILKSKTQSFSSTDVVIIEETQNTGKVENREIKRKIIPETVETISKKKVRLFDESETISKKKVRLFDESEQIDDFNTSESIVEDAQDANGKEIDHKIIPESSDFQSSERISKKACSFNESEQRNISDKSNVVSNIQNDGGIAKNIQLSNESPQRNISDSNDSSFVYNTFTEQPQIIPESCFSSEKDVANNSSNKNNQKRVLIISETCDKDIKNNFTIEKVQQNVLRENKSFEKSNQQKNILREKVELQQQENILMNEENHSIRESNVYSVKNNQQQNDRLQDGNFKPQQSKITFINEENSLTLEKNDLTREKNDTVVEKDKVSNRRENTGLENCENSENSKPRIISIQETDNIGICVQRHNKKNIPEKISQDLLKGQSLNSAFNSEREEKRNQEDRKATENKIQETYVKTEEPRRKGENWYNKYLNGEFTDEILRKDIPCGKIFTKTHVTIPKKILKMDDFVL